jgi:hypothetical protein
MRLAVADFVALVAISSHLSALELPGQELILQRSRDGLPVVVVRTGEGTLRFAIDTGTSRSMVSADVAERLHLTSRESFVVASAGGEPQAALCATPPKLDLGGVELSIDCLAWIPAERRLAGSEDVDGLLGADALAAADLWIDVRRGRARLAPPGSLIAWAEGTRIPLGPSGRRPTVTMQLPSLGRDVAAQLVVDSGAQGLLLFGPLARRAEAVLGNRRLLGRLLSPTARLQIIFVPLGAARAGGMNYESGWTGLLPQVGDRREDGLVPLSIFGPVLIDMSHRILVARARLRAMPGATIVTSLAGADALRSGLPQDD